MPYKQKPGRGPMMKTGRGLRKDLLGPAAHEPGHDGEEDPRFKYNDQGQQIGMKDPRTGGYYTPSDKAFKAMKAKAEKIGRAPRPYKGRFTEFGDKDRAAGFVSQAGEFKRATNKRQLESLRKEYDKDRRNYEAEEKRRAERRGRYLDYTGTTIKKIK